MASFFQKVVSTQCTGANDPKCQKFVNKERLPPFRKRCPDCGSDTKEIVRPDQAKVLAAAALALLISGGGTFAASQGLRSWAMNLVHPIHDSDPRRDDNGARSPEDAQKHSGPISLDWTLETEHDGARRMLSTSEDFSAEAGHVFKTRDAFHEGDRLRLVASTNPAKMIYVFYLNGGEAKRLAADDAGKVTVPTDSDEWFKLDSHPGTEEFVMVASNEHQRKLDDLTGDNLGADTLDKQFRDLSGRKDVALTRVMVRHE